MRKRLTLAAAGFAAAAIAATVVPGAAANAAPSTHGIEVKAVLSDLRGAQQVDQTVQRSWGVALGPTGAGWVSENARNIETLFEGGGRNEGVSQKPPVHVQNGSPTGVVFNDTKGFKGAKFIIASKDGSIDAFFSGTNTFREVSVRGASYTGISLIHNYKGHTVLAAANNRQNRVDLFNSDYKFIGSIRDPHISRDARVFNVAELNRNTVLVTFESSNSRNSTKGWVDAYSENMGFMYHYQNPRNSVFDGAWGVVNAPSGFEFPGAILIGNHDSGTIAVFNGRGHFVGFLKGTNGRTIVISGLYGLAQANGDAGDKGEVLFASAPNRGNAGIIGTLRDA
ncbi:TIGR03118 family protein [Actinoplanes sp. TBRC 11911]|uniref:TIGR03118 family protein n=1 Tax=Actinoplanes sp. TBRC 11911 TaxID=2729386 RepID=UPI00145E8262|nr:TIGR03118 family protein [Actinoplanes sp. TBRC 11911]NMO53691.1 TIGR03118 family protein [Actinoplanes sp. TBRC 11911]